MLISTSAAETCQILEGLPVFSSAHVKTTSGVNNDDVGKKSDSVHGHACMIIAFSVKANK